MKQPNIRIRFHTTQKACRTMNLLFALMLLLGAMVSGADTETSVNEELAEEIALMLRGSIDSYNEYAGTNPYTYDGYGSDEVHGRKLSGWSWSNLLCTFVLPFAERQLSFLLS